MIALALLLAQIPSGDSLPSAGARCSAAMESGSILTGAYPPAEFAHQIDVRNGSSSVAYVKVRNVVTEQRTLMYLMKGGSGSIADLPDGTYEIMFAFGGHLAADCKSIVQPRSVSKFLGAKNLVTTVIDKPDGREIETQSLSFTLYSVPNGNVRPTSISAAEFNRD